MVIPLVCIGALFCISDVRPLVKKEAVICSSYVFCELGTRNQM